MMTTSVLCLAAMATLCVGRAVRPGNDRSMLDTMFQLAQNVDHLRIVPTPVAEKSQGPIPGGRLNVCEDLCPKWCQKASGSENNFTDCHYMCGNICDNKQTFKNPYIGNKTYEVVPIEYSFAKYDADQDKLITLEEFAAVERVPLGEALDLFTFADVNYDGFIDTKEFKGGPLVFTVQMAEELNSMVRQTKPPSA